MPIHRENGIFQWKSVGDSKEDVEYLVNHSLELIRKCEKIKTRIKDRILECTLKKLDAGVHDMYWEVREKELESLLEELIKEGLL